MWSPKKLDFLFYDFCTIYYDFFEDLGEIKRKRQNRATVAKSCSKPLEGVI